MKFHLLSQEDTLKELASSREGLSPQEAAARLARDGRNKLAAPKGKSLLQRFLAQLADPMILILLAAAAVSGVLAAVNGESFADVFIILAVVLINAVLGVFQESKAEKAIEALQEMSAAESSVLRGGSVMRLPGEELVRGDIVLLEAGDSVPADGRLLECASLKIEEAPLTGESVPVEKSSDDLPAPENGMDVPLGDRRNMAYMGSTVVYGRGVLLVTETGMQTEMGRIAGALSKAEDGETPLQLKLKQLSKVLTWLVLGICVVVFALQVIRAGGFTVDTILNSFMAAVSLAVAAIPEGLAAVVTVVLSIGVTNMSRRNAIIRKLTAVETLGCAQIICSDKTGTLTKNSMTVVDFSGDSETETACGMALCSDAELNEDGSVTGEPTEAALVAWAHKLGKDKPVLKAEAERIGEAPFDSQRKMMSTVHRTQSGIVQYTKGAPDMLLAHCTFIMKDGVCVAMTDADREAIRHANKAMADKALRVLACAKRVHAAVPESCSADALEQELCFLGLCGMIDPIRPEVAAAIKECRRAGIRPIMITGDQVDTAGAIARELGILEEGYRAISGQQLSAMSDEEFEKCFREISVYARVQPEHKTRIVKAWQKAGFVTAMTGDGVNDAPSIKTSDIGVGMGITGTDVTKNVADMVLADDNFATIVGAVEEGRRIYDNIRKAIQFLLSSNMSEVLAVFVSTLLGFTVLRPVHLLWINLITDCFPALALGMEKAEPGLMERKPRPARLGLFAEGMGVGIAYQGAVITLLVLLSYFTGAMLETGRFAPVASTLGMTMAFITMSLTEVFHSINMRSQKKSIFGLHTGNPVLAISAVCSGLVTLLVCLIPAVAGVFGLTPVTAVQFLISCGYAVLIVPIVEAVKALTRKK